MKKIVFFSFLILLSVVSTRLFGNSLENQPSCFSGTFSAGYVFKHDCKFKDVYGRGIVNALTFDGCYYPWELWGFGSKISYWRTKGCTSFLKQRSLLQEVPITFYLRRVKNFECGLQMYGSLGGGFIWIKERSYLGDVRVYKGVGEVEAGLNSPVWHHLNLTIAFRYLFPSQCHAGEKVNIGGSDLRAGIGFSF